MGCPSFRQGMAGEEKRLSWGWAGWEGRREHKGGPGRESLAGEMLSWVLGGGNA